jgi:hypothetical protein
MTMMKKLFLLALIFTAIGYKSAGQEENRRFLSPEAGIDGIGCEAPEKDYIRAVTDQDPADYYSDQINSLMTVYYAGCRFEYRMFNNLLGLSAGLRFNRMTTSIGRESYMLSDPDYFYVNYYQSGQVTEYAKVREITQDGDYIGIPLEVRLYPRKEHRIRLYYKAGLSFNLKVHSRSDIVFFDSSMEQYRADVMKVVEKASPYYTTFHLGLGVKIGKTTKPAISFETYTPIGVIFPKGAWLVDPIAGSGLQLVLSFPLNSVKE